MALLKQDGMWISDWNKSTPEDSQGCRQRQREQTKKAKELVAKMKTQGWKKLTSKKANEIMNTYSMQISKAIESHDQNIKKKWGQKKVKMWNRKNASNYFVIGDWIWHIGSASPLEALAWGELGGYSALLNKGNQYRIIFSSGSDDDESGYWSKPVTQIVFKSKAAKPAAKKPKAPARKPKAKAKPRTKAKSGRKAPEISATRRKIGTRMRGNDGNMWEVKPSGKSQRWIRGAENWGGDPEGQLAQALERARTSPAPPPLEITELPKLCQLCGDESPQAFGLYDEDDLLIGEIWACDGGCAQPLADSRNLSFGAEENYNDFISDMESVMEKYGELVHFESEFNPSDRILNVSFALEVESSDFDEVVFEAENTTQKFTVGDKAELPDADSWLIYHHPIEDLPENHVRAFMSGNAGEKVDLSQYELVAEVLGGYAPFSITQNISDSWHKNSTTISNLGSSSDGYRSTSVSDVVCDPETGQCFLVGNFGYIALEPVDSFEAPLTRHNLNRFKPDKNARKKSGYWRKKGKDYIWGRNRER